MGGGRLPRVVEQGWRELRLAGIRGVACVPIGGAADGRRQAGGGVLARRRGLLPHRRRWKTALEESVGVRILCVLGLPERRLADPRPGSRTECESGTDGN